jgi:hypothetical protein
VVKIHGDQASIVCNECGAIVRTIRAVEVERTMHTLMMDAAGSAMSSARCPHCGSLNSFPGFTAIEVFVCAECGEGVSFEPPVQ